MGPGGRGWRRDDGGDEGREVWRGQAINTTRRHARRQATPKARFIRARTKGRRVDFYLENLPTVGSLVSNYRNAVALGHSCLAPLSSIFPPQRSLNLYDNRCKSAVSFIEQTCHRYLHVYARESFHLEFDCIVQLQSIVQKIG